MSVKRTAEYKTAKAACRKANKESKSIFGILKIINKLWGTGFNVTFKTVGILDKKNLKIELLDQCNKNNEGEVYELVIKYQDEKKTSWTYEQKPVKVWTTTRLFECLYQAQHPEEYQDNMDE